MKRIISFVLFGLLFLSGISVLVTCKKNEEKITEKPTLDLGNPYQVTMTAFKIEGEVTDDGGADVTDRGICLGASTWPTTDDTKISSGNGTGKFTCDVTGLNNDTRYYVRGFATSSAGTAYSVEKIVVTSNEEVSDFEGNRYQAVKIGNQIWMRENLRSKKYADGSTIEQGGYPAGNNEAYVESRGRLYSWYAVMNGEPGSNDNPSPVQGICPTGYHVPSDAEWLELEIYLGMDANEAITTDVCRGMINGKLKYPDSNAWAGEPLILGDNFSGFSCLPAGYCWKDGSGFDIFWFYFFGAYYTSTEASDTTKANQRFLPGDSPCIWRYDDLKGYALSIRCVKNK